MTYKTNQERVKLGAEILDKIYPYWWTNINTEILDIDSINKCILSQLYNGDYLLGKHLVNGLGYSTTECGFMFIEDESPELNDFWKEEIEKRLKTI